MNPLRLIALICFLCGACFCAHGDTISWWRFEEDLDTSATGFENPNEVGDQPALISNNATLGTLSPDLFDSIVPGPQVPNTASVRAVNQGGSAGIFGSAAYSPTLDVASMTVEFWVRTTESDAGFVARTSDPNLAGEAGTISNGFRIVDPNSVRVDFWTAELNNRNRYRRFSNNPARNPVQTTIDSGISINDGDWHYIAFRYDQDSGIGQLIVDNDVTEVDLDDGRLIFWGGQRPGRVQSEVTMGYLLDGNSGNNNGTLDEVRFTDQFEADEDLLSPIPEPGTLLMGSLLGLFAFLGEWFRRLRNSASARGH
ncbi:MAG: hypothetical protein AAF212_06055 [Verrucomicrobiota bacterium]